MELLPVVLSIVAGLVLLFAGRRFFWLAAALVAFLFTYSLFDELFGGGLLGLVVAIVLAAIFAWLAIKFIKIVGYIVGALAGAAGLPIFLSFIGLNPNWLLYALIGAVIGFVIMVLAFDWGLILLTAWLGANAVAGNINTFITLGATITMILLAILFVAGVIVQSRKRG